MKTSIKTALALLALCTSAMIVTAQDGPPQDGQRPPRPQGQPGMEGRRPLPVPPLMAALDANHDGVIDETEIANASKALKTLDKNGDGKITRQELRPPRPEGVDGQGGPRGPRGQGPVPGGPQQDE